MHKFSDNYYHRKCYFEKEQVPTQSVMKDKMKPPLANMCFKTMSPKLKQVAGLEPPLKGGGSEWYMPPEEILAGKVVLKPVKLEHLKKMGFVGISEIGDKMRQKYHMDLSEEQRRALKENDTNWKRTILKTNRQLYVEDQRREARANTATMKKAINEFEVMYKDSITNMESMMFDAATLEIKRIREESFQSMKQRYAEFLKYDSTKLYDEYDAKFTEKKTAIKAKFLKEIKEMRFNVLNMYHDIQVEKHTVIEKLRHMLQCQNLACQTYIALKEREECEKEIKTTKHYHDKKVKYLKDDIALKDFEIRLEINQQKERQEFDRIWRQKVCHVVKQFQYFVEYCLRILPQHAEFFLNMEKLMLLQLNAASEDPFSESIIEKSESNFQAPTPKPHPYYLFCDKGYKPPNIEQKLCPKHCTSSASHIPVVIINNRYIYSECDNFELYSDKVVQYLSGPGDDAWFEDNHRYDLDAKVKYTSSDKLQDIQLESSIMQVLEQELPNRTQLPIACPACQLPYCFCSPLHPHKPTMQEKPKLKTNEPAHSINIGNQLKTRSAELRLIREPKWESYLEYIMPRNCKCAKMAKKHLEEHLPVYMGKTSPFEPPELPNYEPCSPHTLRELVRRAKGIRATQPPIITERNTRDVGTQYSDHEFDYLCECFSDDAVTKLYDTLIQGSQKLRAAKTSNNPCIILDGSRTPSYLTKSAPSFATHRAYSLRNLIGDAPELEEIFKTNNCELRK